MCVLPERPRVHPSWPWCSLQPQASAISFHTVLGEQEREWGRQEGGGEMEAALNIVHVDMFGI